MTELPLGPFGRLNRLLGYVIAIVAIAMPVHAIRPQPQERSSTDTNMAAYRSLSSAAIRWRQEIG
jgi:hypothetical protein